MDTEMNTEMEMDTGMGWIQRWIVWQNRSGTGEYNLRSRSRSRNTIQAEAEAEAEAEAKAKAKVNRMERQTWRK